MALAFTPDQRAVIDARKQNILVSAAAGSGKTAVLVQRIVELICDAENPVDVDHLLVVTFTEAAAAEMKARVSKALNSMLESAYELNENTPENIALIQHLERQNVLVHRSFIMTIDAFCKFVVSNNYSEVGLEPNFRVMDEGEKKLLQEEVLEELFEELYSSEDKNFFDAIEGLSDRGKDEELKEIVLKIFSTSESFPWPDKWLKEAVESYKQFNHSMWLKRLIDDVKLRLACGKKQLLKARNLCMEDVIDLQECIDVINSDIAIYEDICKNLDKADDCLECYNDLEAAFEKKPDHITWPRKGKNKVLKDKAKAIRDNAKEILSKIAETYFYLPGKVWQLELNETGTRVETVIGLVREFDRRFRAAKAKEAMVDFSDLEHMALKILLKDEDETKPSEIAIEYAQYFSEIMIDEYQDSNEVQEVLLKALCREHLTGDLHKANRFMVGDVKQSIYRFRKADPRLIINKMNSYGRLESDQNRRIDLQSNFRSRKEVLDCVNAIFEKIMIPEVGGVIYDEAARLNQGSTIYTEAEGVFKPELHLLGLSGETKDKFEAQVNLIADIIEEQIRVGKVSEGEPEGETQKCKLRPVNYGDIAILLRTMKSRGDTIRKVFAKRGIPVKVISSEKYYNSLEISQILQYLKILDNPLQDVAFVSVCVSPLGGFDDSQMAQIVAAFPEEEFYNKFQRCVQEYIEGAAEGPIKELGIDKKVDEFLAIYKELRTMSRYENLEHLIARLYELTGYRYYVSALPEGESRLNNLELLLERARQFAQTNYSGIFNFLQYVDKLMESEKEPGGAGSSGEGSSEVKVYTMHKSKGLEFPVCIVCDLQTQFNTRDENLAFLLDNEMGVACNYTDTTRRVRRDTVMRKVFAKKEDIDLKGEALRILYVALTRAKEKLIMVGSVPPPSAKALKENSEADGVQIFLDAWKNKWDIMDSRADYLQIANCKSLLDMVMYGFGGYSNNIISHKVSDSIDKTIEKEINAFEVQNQDKLLIWAINHSKDSYSDFEQKALLPYAHSELEGLYTKTSVSELKMAAMKEALEGEGPKWMFEGHEVNSNIYSESDVEEAIHESKGEFTSVAVTDEQTDNIGNLENVIINGKKVNPGALYGTAQHRIMELISFEKAMSEQDEKALFTWLKTQIKEMSESGKIDKELKNIINVRKIISFLQSDYAKRMGQAEADGLLHKEQPFFLSVPANELDKKYPKEESLLIQGIIDVYWVEDGEIVLLDYKTDSVTEASELVTRYKTQMDYYARALEQGTGMKVKEQVLYSFKLNEFVVI